ncbi:MAG TPA: hypothetical protein VFO10_15490 [Oligoflexus sp.]|uniref:hypothetical protein n=1 Tax=Oligoflexus sp. TaxID=1971216 RepID=UPI002D81163C|nr:hypothetical protein [Oligoflexus sp.]HET9238664.1 hypothetical protein [Oligoflexus sp.]
MRRGLLITLFGMLMLSMSACQKSKADDTAPLEEAEAEAVTSNADVKTPEPAAPVTCRSLNIPTYELLIKDLSALRCDSCHNETFAWKGIVLTQYDAWQTYVKPIRNRIFYNLLTQPLEPGEQEIFLSWIDNGLPKTDADCTAKK